MLAITVLLLNRKRLSAKALADRFEVSTKTIYRDIEALSLAGIPIVAHQGTTGGFEIMEQFTISRQFLALDELLSMLAAVQGIRTAFDDQSVSNLLEKVKTMLQPTERELLEHGGAPLTFDFNPWGQSASARARVQALRTAIGERRTVTFRYTNLDGAGTERTVEPIGLILKGYLWYLHAYCTLRGEFRVFRLSRVRELRVTEERFEPRPAPALDSYSWQPEWSGSGALDVVLTFRPEVRDRVEDTFPTEQAERLPDGSIRIRGNYPANEWLYGWMLSFGDKVRIDEPAFIARELKERAQKIIAQYAEL
ncbi:helix-turn-helix transcriptional regulator [Paenibacillus elgii]|uniref:helix-turn-helix transcriptional regulator n=1 Tax=Paenibacillus elgii TaxID=189691 RepID=UPI001EF9604A|nr:YafY family protein [Paenibacillus elgii]